VPTVFRKQRAQLAQQLHLGGGELYRVPAYFRWLRIAEGMAYVTHAGQDHILAQGEEIQLDTITDIALISAIACRQVHVELFESQN